MPFPAPWGCVLGALQRTMTPGTAPVSPATIATGFPEQHEEGVDNCRFSNRCRHCLKTGHTNTRATPCPFPKGFLSLFIELDPAYEAGFSLEEMALFADDVLTSFRTSYPSDLEYSKGGGIRSWLDRKTGRRVVLARFQPSFQATFTELVTSGFLLFSHSSSGRTFSLPVRSTQAASSYSASKKGARSRTAPAKPRAPVWKPTKAGPTPTGGYTFKGKANQSSWSTPLSWHPPSPHPPESQSSISPAQLPSCPSHPSQTNTQSDSALWDAVNDLTARLEALTTKTAADVALLNKALSVITGHIGGISTLLEAADSRQVRVEHTLLCLVAKLNGAPAPPDLHLSPVPSLAPAWAAYQSKPSLAPPTLPYPTPDLVLLSHSTLPAHSHLPGREMPS